MRKAVVLVLLLAGLALAPYGGASASCAGPMLAPPTGSVSPGGSVRVTGRFFVDGCDDTGGGDAFGCSTQKPEPEAPYSDIVLSVRQHGRVWRLGTADAGTADQDRLGRVGWTVTLPDGLEPGRAVLVTSPGRARLPIRVSR